MEPSVIHIQSFNKKGWGVGPSSLAIVEVIGVLPEEEVRVDLGRRRKGRCRGELREILQRSQARVEPRCAHVPLCGGCSWQQMAYDAQLAVKQRHLKQLFDGDIRPIIPCSDPWQYRNKMEFSFSENKAGERFLGLVIAGSKGHVLNLKECHLVDSWFVQLLDGMRAWWERSDLKAYRLNDTGALRTLILREGKRTGKKLVMLTVSGNPAYALKQEQIQSFVAAIRGVLPDEDVSIFLRVQQACKGFPTQFFEMHLAGPDHLLEKCEIDGKEFTFKISPSSFFQPNTYQAEKLYAAALKMIDGDKEHVLDLYAGIGTLGLIFAKKAKRVTSVELNPYAVYDAESNKELNGIDNYQMLKGDVGQVLEKWKQAEDFVQPDLVIVDPPRTGLDTSALNHLISLKSKEILYISCNPLTQAANIKELQQAGYELICLQPVDQFPHTIHLETIALLKYNIKMV